MLDPICLTEHYHTRNALSPADLRRFRDNILAHHRTNPRPMAWRETTDPYAILVSEIMLQQTQVERVQKKYAEFMAIFPDIAALSSAPLELLLRTWQGLGYNRRAIALQRCAQAIENVHGGVFPMTIAELEALPGIGPYTARAVAAFSFGIAEPLIETNIRTVFIHFFFHDRESVGDREIMPLVATTLDQRNPREWYYALMDYGVYLKGIHPNPGRRSRHHQRQSRFEGSNRQLRSRLLQEIMDFPGMTAEELALRLGSEIHNVAGNLTAMEKEGFLSRDADRYRINSGA